MREGKAMRYLHELYSAEESGGGPITMGSGSFLIPGYAFRAGKKQRVHVLAMGDVGATLTLAMKLTGGDTLSEIGIRDINPTVMARYEQELNQICSAGGTDSFPPVIELGEEDLFRCDVFVFCASLGVPPVGERNVDVRMVQLERNARLIGEYARQAVSAGFAGDFFVVSDPVDFLCAEAAKAGLPLRQIQGFGLGVMNGRAAYYAAREQRFSRYLREGRVFGPHGEDLVVADSIANYHHRESLALTEKTVGANLAVRELGYKPYIAPAVSSGALSILANLRGDWNDSSAWFGEAFLGMRNRRTAAGLEIEDLPLPEDLYRRIETAYHHLRQPSL